MTKFNRALITLAAVGIASIAQVQAALAAGLRLA